MRPCTRTRSIKDVGAVEGVEQQLLDTLERGKEDLLCAGDAFGTYDGSWQGDELTDSSMRVARFLRYRRAVRTFMDDFFFFTLGSFK
jgi:hypothetical protein